MDYQLSLMSEEEAAKYAQIRAMMQSLVVYMGIQDTDFYGSAPYSEAYRARYGGTLTPKYDTQKELFTQFYNELKEATDVLVNGKYVAKGEVVVIEETPIAIVEITSPSSVFARTFAFSIAARPTGSLRLVILPVTKLR